MLNVAFLVGCHEYADDKINNLGKGIIVDILEMQRSLLLSCGFSEKDIFIISRPCDEIDAQASIGEPTHMGIITSLKNSSGGYGKKEINNLFFYYSGHGYISENEEAILVPEDYILDDDSYKYSELNGAIPINIIIAILKKKFRFKHLIIVLDMCMEELRFKSVLSKKTELNSDYFPKGVCVFYSCFPHSKAFIIPEELETQLGKGSVYTRLFVRALQDDNCNTLNEIDRFIKNHIYEYTGLLGRVQQPFTSWQDTSLQGVSLKDNPTVDDGDAVESDLKIDPFDEEKTEASMQSYVDRMDAFFHEDKLVTIINGYNTFGIRIQEEDIYSIYQITKTFQLDSVEEIFKYGQDVIDEYSQYYIIICQSKNRDDFLDLKGNFESYIQSLSSIVGTQSEIDNEASEKIRIEQLMNKSLFKQSLQRIKNDLGRTAKLFLSEAIKINEEKENVAARKKELCLKIIAGKVYNNNRKVDDALFLEKRIQHLNEIIVNEFDKMESFLQNLLESVFSSMQICQDTERKFGRCEAKIRNIIRRGSSYTEYQEIFNNMVSEINKVKKALEDVLALDTESLL